MKTLIEIYDKWADTSGGIFTDMQTLNVPWKEESIADVLDLVYYGQHSGDKILSPFLSKLLVGGELTDANRAKIASSVVTIYGANWAKLWETLSFDYNPIENYRMEETMTDDETVTDYGKTSTRTDDLEHTKTGSTTDTPNITVTTESGSYGFNSATLQPTDSDTQTTAGTDVESYNITEEDNGTQAIVDSGRDISTRNYLLTRSGNIGVTTSQQMIESERALWVWNYFNDVVFPDLDRFLALSVY